MRVRVRVLVLVLILVLLLVLVLVLAADYVELGGPLLNSRKRAAGAAGAEAVAPIAAPPRPGNYADLQPLFDFARGRAH